MGVFGMKIGKRTKEIEVNDALLKMEKMAEQMAKVSGNTVTANICMKRIEQLRTENRNLKRGLA